MNFSTILENFGISADEVSEQYGIFGSISKASNWERAKSKIHVKSFLAMCFDTALSGRLDDFICGVKFVVARVELYLEDPQPEEFSVWVCVFDEYHEFISYALIFLKEEFKFDEESKEIIAVLFWITRNVNSMRTICSAR